MSIFEHLEKRSAELLYKFILPIIEAENIAIANSQAIPAPDFDSLAAFRLLTHAELEGYFEQKAMQALDKLQQAFNSDKMLTKDFASLIFLQIWVERYTQKWSEQPIERKEFKQMAQCALGFARQFIKNNNGIKEHSITVLSAIMGFFGDELDNVLVNELNQYGKLRGDVAHDSWAHNTRTFESAEIERKRLETILRLTKEFYEK